MARNLEVENKAIEYVLELEKNNNPIDCHQKSVGFDVECDDKIIEIKGSTEKNIPFVVLNSSNLKALKHYKPFFIYVIYNLNETPKLLKIDKETVLSTKKEKVSWEIPLRAAQYKDVIVLDKKL